MCDPALPSGAHRNTAYSGDCHPGEQVHAVQPPVPPLAAGCCLWSFLQGSASQPLLSGGCKPREGMLAWCGQHDIDPSPIGLRHTSPHR